MGRASHHEGQYGIGLADGRNLAAGDAMARPHLVRRLDMCRRDDRHRLLTVCEYIFGWNPGIDEAIFRDFTSRSGMPAGRMALSTACSLVLVGSALVLFHRAVPGAQSRQWFSLPAGSPSSALPAMFTEVPFYPDSDRLNRWRRTQPSHSWCFAPAFFLRCRKHGLVATLLLPGLSGRIARRLIPTALVVPLVLGWLRLQGQHLGWYGTEFGIAILVVSYCFGPGGVDLVEREFAVDLEAAEERSQSRASKPE